MASGRSNKRKRDQKYSGKHEYPPHPTDAPSRSNAHEHDFDLEAFFATLHLRGYEATLVHGQEARAAAVESQDSAMPGASGKGGLILLNPDLGISDSEKIWVDRFDARLLLPPQQLVSSPVVPIAPKLTIRRSSPDSPWQDLPSDSEDTFFFTPSEVENYHREKRLRMMESDRQERLRLLREEDVVEDSQDDKSGHPPWGDENEVPDSSQLELMRRTAAHLASSPSSKQLELRILANHGADPRFAFLRGRWKNTWEMLKRGKTLPSDPTQGPNLTTSLAQYSSESDATDHEDGSPASHDISPARGNPAALFGNENPPSFDMQDSSADQERKRLQELRRERAKEWSRKRKEQSLTKE